MSDMLIMTTLEFRDPVTFFILMKTGDPTLDTLCRLHRSNMCRTH